MHHRFDPPAGVGLDRDHVAAVPLGDQRFLQVGGDRLIVQQLLHAIQQPVMDDAQLAAHLPKLGGGVIQDLAPVRDGRGDRINQPHRRW